MKLCGIDHHPPLTMLLPEKIRVAIDILARYDMAPGKVVPRWYRFYLKFKPDTPPPLFDASKGALRSRSKSSWLLMLIMGS